MQTNVNFQLSKNVLGNKESLTVVFRPNSKVDEKTVFQFAIQQKERTLFSKEMSFQPNQETKLTIDDKEFQLLAGGVLTAVLKNIQPWVIYAKEGEKKESWEYTHEDFARFYEPMGEILFFKKPSETLELVV